MKRLSIAFIGLATILPVACNSASSSSTAPSTNPNRPGEIRTLKIKVPAEKSIKQNSTADVDVTVDRKNFKGDVTLAFTDLPPGVTVASTDLTVPADKDSFKVALKAAADAKVENDQKVHVTAKAQDMHAESVEFKLEVKPKD
jgi:hypothetical protein